MLDDASLGLRGGRGEVSVRETGSEGGVNASCGRREQDGGGGGGGGGGSGN